MGILIVIAIVVLFALGAGLAVNHFWLRADASRRNTLGLPTCAKCGYIVRGVESLDCPECGSDLREVGIIIPGTMRSPATGCFFPLVLTFCIAILAWVLGPAFESLLPRYVVQYISIELSSPSHPYDASIRLQAIETVSSRSWNSERVQKAILPRPQPVNHQVDHRQLDHRDAA